MIEIEKPNISTVPSEDEKNVKFVVEPLEPRAAQLASRRCGNEHQN